MEGQCTDDANKSRVGGNSESAPMHLCEVQKMAGRTTKGKCRCHTSGNDGGSCGSWGGSLSIGAACERPGAISRTRVIFPGPTTIATSTAWKTRHPLPSRRAPTAICSTIQPRWRRNRSIEERARLRARAHVCAHGFSVEWGARRFRRRGCAQR